MNRRMIVAVGLCSIAAGTAAFLASNDSRFFRFYSRGKPDSVLTDEKARERLLQTARQEGDTTPNSVSQDLLHQQAADWAEIEKWHRDRRNER